MSEVTNNGRKKLVIILVAAIAVLALVLGLCIFFAGNQPAEPTDPTSGTTGNVPAPTDPPVKTGVWHCICGSQTEQHLTGCNGTEVQWTEWTATDALPITTGNYYLTADVTLLTADNVADVVGEQKICLDLNGHTINSETRVYRLNDKSGLAELTLLDSVGTGKVIMTKHPNGASLALVGNANILNVYGGTYDGSALSSMGESGNDPKNGGLIRGDGVGNTINIHGGTFIGAEASNSGGVLFAQNGFFTMTGGEMMNGFGSNGGNIHVRQTEVTISGGKIHNGTATLDPNGRGGNIFVNVSKVTISGTAEIYDGSAVYLGNNIFHNDGSTLKVSGAKVYMTGAEGDQAIYPVLPNPEDPNHMVCICGSSTSSHKPGCDGTKYAWRPWTDAGTLPSTSGKYYLAVDVKVGTTVPITGNQEIYIDLNGHKISSDTRIYLMNPAKCDDTLTILDSTGKGKVVMTKFTDGATFIAMGNTGNKKLVIYGGTFDASTIKAEANGGFVRVGSETSSMEIHGGTIIGAAAANNGGTIFVANGAKLTMTGGEIKNGHANNGGNIVLNAGSVFKMTGGKIHHGTAAFINDKNEEFGRGGNIFVNGAKLEIGKSAQVYDGTVNYHGENIFYNTGSELDIKGKVYLTGSDFDGIYPIPAADVDEGHKVCICGSSTDVHKPGCDGTKHAWSPWTVSTTLPSASGKYYLDCDITLDEAVEVTGNEAIYIDLNGHTITSSVRAYLDRTTNSIFSLTLLDSVGTGKMVGTETNTTRLLATIITKGEKVITIYGGTYDTSAMASTNNGALLSAHDADSTVNIHGGTFIGPKSSNIGGLIVVENGALNITGGEIKNGTAQSGGNVYVKDATFTMTGGKIYGGIANGSNARGGNIFNNGSTINISGTVEIYDGTAASGANIYNMGEYEFENTGNVYLTGSSSNGIYPINVTEELHISCICGSNSDDPAEHKPGCDGTKYDDWEAWTYTDSLPIKDGRYYLYDDVIISGIQTITEKDANIVVDLNGKKVSFAEGAAKDARVYNMISTNPYDLTILDSKGTAVIDLGERETAGALVALHQADKTFTLYGGTIDGSKVVGTNHGAIIRNIGHVVNIHGGTIIGGDGTPKSKNGGVINVSAGGTLNMTGGTIEGGKAVNGGNICIEDGTLNLAGGTVQDGTCTSNGANIYINDTVAEENYTIAPETAVGFTDPAKTYTGIYPDETMTGYKVAHMLQNVENDEYSELIVEKKAGMAGFLTEAAVLTDTRVNGFTAKAFEQVTIADDGTTIVTIYYDRNSYNVTWFAQDGNSVIESGTVKFGATLTAPEAPTITDYLFTGWDPEAPATMPAEDVSFTAQYIYGKLVHVYFNSNGGSAVAPQELAENTVATLPTEPTKPYMTFAGWYTDEALTTAWNIEVPVAEDITLYAKWTDAISWTEWTDATTLPSTPGYYKLMVPVTVSETILLETAGEIVIDLNNQIVTGNTNSAIYTFASAASTTLTVSVWDSGTTGTINLGACRLGLLNNTSANGRMGDYIFNVQGGTINGGTYNNDNGGVFLVSGSNNKLNISGGTIKGAAMTSYSGGVAQIKTGSTLTMTGGTLYGGNAKNGGNLICQDSGKIYITGGEVHSGRVTDRGGNIFVSNSGTCVISGTAKVYDGVTTNTDATKSKSGNIIVLSGATGFFSDLDCKTVYDPSTCTNVYMTADSAVHGILNQKNP